MKVFLLLLALAGTAQAREELHYFTSTTCGPCAPVTKIVTALNNNDRDITVHVWQQNEAPFEYYKVDFIPAFLVIENGKVKKRYVQENVVDGFRFTPSFVSGIAPFKSKRLDPEPVQTERDCANPIGKPFRNLIPPPPAPLPDDVPDRVKVKRIEDLEKLVSDQNTAIQELDARLTSVESNLDKLVDAVTLITARLKALPEPVSDSLTQDIKSLKVQVSNLKTLPRRFVIVDGDEILADLTYEPGEIVVLDRKVIVTED